MPPENKNWFLKNHPTKNTPKRSPITGVRAKMFKEILGVKVILFRGEFLPTERRKV
jgi:hypothetical protein